MSLPSVGRSPAVTGGRAEFPSAGADAGTGAGVGVDAGSAAGVGSGVGTRVRACGSSFPMISVFTVKKQGHHLNRGMGLGAQEALK